MAEFMKRYVLMSNRSFVCLCTRCPKEYTTEKCRKSSEDAQFLMCKIKQIHFHVSYGTFVIKANL